MVHQQLMLITDLTTSNSVIKYPRYTNTCAYFLCKLQRQMARFMTCNGTVNLQIYGFRYVMMILTLFLLRRLLGMLARRDLGAWDGRRAGEEAADLLFLPNPREIDSFFLSPLKTKWTPLPPSSLSLSSLYHFLTAASSPAN